MDNHDEERINSDQPADIPEESPREKGAEEPAAQTAADDPSGEPDPGEPAGQEPSDPPDPMDEILLDGEPEAEQDGEPGEEDEEEGAPRLTRRTIMLLLILILGGAVLAAAVIGYHAKVSGVFSEATMGLYEARRGDGTGRGIETGVPGDPGQEGPRRVEFENFVLHVGVEHGPDRIIYYDLALEMPGDMTMEDSDIVRMRTLIYRASKGLASEADLAKMPPRTVRRELERRILEAARADSVMAVYFTRFVMI